MGGDGRYPLEPSTAEMESMGRAAVEFLARFIHDLPESPASDLDDVPDIKARPRPRPSPGPAPFDDLMAEVAGGAAKGFNTAGPGYLGYIPGGGLYAAALADFLACGINRYVGVWSAAPRLVQLELDVIDWLARSFGYPAEARGILTSGGSMANFSAVVAARRALLPEDFLRGTLYVSDQTHASVAKSAVLAGFPARNVRTAPRTSRMSLDPDGVRDLIRRDRADGWRPFFLVASAGTTNTGAVDPMADLADLCAEEGMWLHADGAYGGMFQLTDRGRRAFAGIDRADSVAVDPHKGMFLPYGTGALLVREGERLRAAHQVEAEYLQDLAHDEDVLNFTDYSPELSRDFRGLRVWMPLLLHGEEAFRAALDEKLDLARYLYQELSATPGFETPWEPELSIVAFRYRPRSGDSDAFGRRLLDRILASRRVFMSSTMIDGRFTIRPCILSHRTHRERVEEAVQIIRAAAVDLDS